MAGEILPGDKPDSNLLKDNPLSVQKRGIYSVAPEGTTKKLARIAVGRTAAVIGIVVLVAVIAISAMVLAPQLTTSPSQTTSSGGNTSTTGSGTTTSASGSQTSTSSSATQGQMALMATDPPVTASGVSKVVVQYNGLAVHEEGSASASGWVNLNSSGSIDLTSTVNVSQTIAVAKLGAGSYDMVRLNITSATVTYRSQNYTAIVRTSELTIHMTGNVQVNSSVSSAVLVDVRTFVVNSANSTSPQFYLSASAVATDVPPSDVTSASLQVGSRLDLAGMPWFTEFEDQTSAKLVISSATLTSNSLSFSVLNSGNTVANIKTVIITPVRAGTKANGSLPSSLTGSAIFTVGSSGSLQSAGSLSLQSILAVAGLNMTSSASTTLGFSGAISLNLGLNAGLGTSIASGQQYLVTVVGDNAFASTTVVAG